MFDNRDTVKFIIPLPPLPSTPIPIIALAGWMSDMPPFPEAAIAALTVASASASAYASASSMRMRHIPPFLTAALSGVSRKVVVKIMLTGNAIQEKISLRSEVSRYIPTSMDFGGWNGMCYPIKQDLTTILNVTSDVGVESQIS
jgi:hypothetical protein